ncbi:MAG: folylpolyglutamate synthase/dihydrofolate synthase family protein [Dehalococcoidia bacterium]
MNYTESLDKLLGLTDLERVSGHGPHIRRYDLGRMEAFLEGLGNPHLKTPTVHVTGTKGKGSTAASIASVLAVQGYTPGLFTSPHLHTFRERIQFDGQPVSEPEFASLVEDIWPVMEAVNAEESYGPITTFEMLTAMAFLYFHRRQAGFQVIEVGLGGRLDSTNLVQPQVCVVTSISLDHTHVLGSTVEKIAHDKAGIIKPGSIAVTSPQQPGVMKVLEKACREQNVTLVPVENECQWTRESFDLDGQTFTVSAPWGDFHLRTPLLGEHQLENVTTALVTLQVLNDLGFTISRNSLDKGFRSVHWPGRMEVLSQEPLLVVDGAHNPYSAARLRQTLHDYFSFDRLIYVVGLSADKNVSGIIQELAQDAATVIVTRSRHPRATSSGVLASGFKERGIDALEIDGVDAALKYALDHAGAGDLIMVTGSIFVAAEAREVTLGIPPELYPSLRPEAQVP